MNGPTGYIVYAAPADIDAGLLDETTDRLHLTDERGVDLVASAEGNPWPQGQGVTR